LRDYFFKYNPMIYKHLIRPFLFLFDAENIHHFVTGSLKFVFKIPGFSAFVKLITAVNHPKLEREVFGIRFKNPVGIAAGFDKNAEIFNELASFGFSHIEIGTVTPLAQPGNKRPRLFRLIADKAIINRMGFNNKGLHEAVKKLKKPHKPIIGGNIGKNTLTPNQLAINDYVTTFEGLFEVVDYFVVNVSCPNISDLRELQDQDALTAILSKLQLINSTKPKRKPILLKVSPDLNQQQLDEVIEIIKVTGIDGVVATNTSITRHTIKFEKEKAAEIGNGGLSGMPLCKRSTEVIRYLSEKSGKAFPIIGVGGIMTAQDALDKLNAGADLVQVYTGFIYEGPFIARKINKLLLKTK